MASSKWAEQAASDEEDVAAYHTDDDDAWNYSLVTKAVEEQVVLIPEKDTVQKGKGASRHNKRSNPDEAVLQAKKVGNKYPCFECKKEFGHREMIQSRRPKHAELVEAAPEELHSGKMETKIIYRKICAACELEERHAAGASEVTLGDIQKVIHRANKGKEWTARGQVYKKACDQAAKIENLSVAERKKMKTNLSKQLAAEFLEMLTKDSGLIEMFGEAGRQVNQANEKMKAIEMLSDQLEATSDPEEVERLLVKLEQAEKEWDNVHEYEVFNDKGPLQHKFLKAQDYDDRLSENLARFYACPHCGTYFFIKFWTRESHPWWCKLDFAKWCRDADKAEVDKLTAAWGKDPSNWPIVGCTKRFQPFAKGHDMVVEFKTSGDEWKAFRADIIPEIVDAAIKKHQVAFNKAAKCLKPEEVYDLIPRTYPKANPVALAGFDEFPGLGKFDYKV